MKTTATTPNGLLQLSKAKAMQCFGKLVEAVLKDPDPKGQAKLTEEYNCKNCDSYSYCTNSLAVTLNK